MTREQKLSLILGFALVLVVGVLVSDHLSGARKVTLEQTDPGAMIASNTEPVIESEPKLVLVSQDGQPIQSPAPAAVEPASSGDLKLAQNPPTTLEKFQREFGKVVKDLREGNGNPAVGPNLDAPVFAESPSSPTEKALNGETPRIAAEPGTTPGPTRAVNTPEYRLYTVKDGDTLWSISTKLLGDGSRHKELAEYNKGRLSSDGGLRVGASIKIPTALMADTKLAERSTEPAATPKIDAPSKPADTKTDKASPAPVKRQPQPTAIAAAETSKSAPTTKTPGATKTSEKDQKAANGKPATYTVKAGDTLGKIAAKTMGSSKRADELAEFNSSALDDEDTLHVGMVLKIPSR